jgi:hypothetical protein
MPTPDVRIHSLKIKTANGKYVSSESLIPYGQAYLTFVLSPVSHGPKTIKLYANKQNMDFDDADSVQETQTLELQESDLDGKSIINLRFVKFQNISSVVVSLGRRLSLAR